MTSGASAGSGTIADFLEDLVRKITLHAIGKDGDHLGVRSKLGGHFQRCSKIQSGAGPHRKTQASELACQIEAIAITNLPFAELVTLPPGVDFAQAFHLAGSLRF